MLNIKLDERTIQRDGFDITLQCQNGRWVEVARTPIKEVPDQEFDIHEMSLYGSLAQYESAELSWIDGTHEDVLANVAAGFINS